MENQLQVLNPIEIRVLGALMEKSKTTPDYYPMTLNALTAACNQKTSRKPVVEYDEETVMRALNSLKGQSLVSTAIGGTSRTVKYKHNFLTIYPLSDPELAVLCLLFLRGPQTPGELNTNSGRVHEFNTLESVYDALEKLSHYPSPFVKELPRRPGQKETRYTQLLGETIEHEENELSGEATHHPASDLEARLSAVEKELTEVKELVAKLMKELLG
jgi:uncharacterized protein YceH (UPF0502 family)